jgi:hypothetical protein
MKQSGLHPTNSTGVGNPGAFRMEIKIFSAEGEERDITQLVDTFEVTESIFQQAMIGEFRIVDGVNLFEELNITGNEKLSVVLRKQLDGDGQAEDMQSDWYVIDIPLFARPKPDIQAYTLRCVSAFGLVSKMRRVQHVMKGTPTDILKRLYEECGVDDFDKTLADYIDFLRPDNNSFRLLVGDQTSAGVMTYIPTKQTYSEAIMQMLSKTAAPNGSPFFCYETFIGGNSVLNSYNNMITTELADTYAQSYFLRADAMTNESFEEQRLRILEISSNLGFSPYKGFRDGSYVTRTHILDWTSKSYQLQDFNAMRDDIQLMDKDLIMHPDFSVSGVDYTNSPDIHGLFYATNRQAMSDRDEVNIHMHMPYVGAKRRAIVSNLGQIEHIIRVHGDPRLLPGRQIGVVIPRSGSEKGDRDEMLSGRYLIVSSIHTFDNNGYHTRLKLARDGIDRGDLTYRPVEGVPNVRYGDEGFDTAPQITNVIGQNPNGPDGGLQNQGPVPVEIVPGYGPGEVDPALAAAVANSAAVAGDTAQRQAEASGGSAADVTQDETGAAVGIETNPGDIDSGEPPTVSGAVTGTVVPDDPSATITEVIDYGSGYNIVRLGDGRVVRRSGARNWRNNNPGNIEYGGFAQGKGAISPDPRFAIFPTYEQGRQAKSDLIFTTSKYKDLPISQAIATYAPAFENNTASYARQVISAAAVPADRGGPDAKMKDLNKAEQERVLDAMEKVEGFKVGTVIELTGYN